MSPWRGCVGQSVPMALVGIALRQPRSHDPEPQRPRFPLSFEGKRNAIKVAHDLWTRPAPRGQNSLLLTFSPRKHRDLLQSLQSSGHLFCFVYSLIRSIMLFLKIEKMQAEATTGAGVPWPAVHPGGHFPWPARPPPACVNGVINFDAFTAFLSASRCLLFRSQLAVASTLVTVNTEKQRQNKRPRYLFLSVLPLLMWIVDHVITARRYSSHRHPSPGCVIATSFSLRRRESDNSLMWQSSWKAELEFAKVGSGCSKANT